MLRIRPPSLEDCLQVIGQVARPRRPPEGDDVLVLLETLRLLGERIAARTDLPRRVIRHLAALPLWTTSGWSTERPVYAVDDPALIEGLRPEVLVWEPGGEVAQFDSLLTSLRITRLGADATTVADPDAAQPDRDATDLLAAAVSLLQDDLARNDPRAASSLTVDWDRLREFKVRIDPDLRVRVDGLIGRRPVEVAVATKADLSSGVLFLRDSRLLRKWTAEVGRSPASSAVPIGVSWLKHGSLPVLPPTRGVQRDV